MAKPNYSFQKRQKELAKKKKKEEKRKRKQARKHDSEMGALDADDGDEVDEDTVDQG